MKPIYFRQAAKIPLLTAAEEIELARAIKAGLESGATRKEIERGRIARERFARSNLRLVFKVAQRYESNSGKLDHDDLIQFGNLGLMRAIDKFDHERGYKFSTYAYAWIRQAIQRGIADQCRTIRLPTHVHDELRNIRKIVAAHEATGAIEPLRDDDIATQLNIPIHRYIQICRMRRDAGSTDVLASESVTEQAADCAPVIEDDERERQKSELLSLIYQLPEQQKNIMIWRYGLDGEQPLTLEEIGHRIALSRERVRQIDVILTNKFRALLA